MEQGAPRYRHAARDGRGEESGEDGVARLAAADAHGKRVHLWMLRRGIGVVREDARLRAGEFGGKGGAVGGDFVAVAGGGDAGRGAEGVAVGRRTFVSGIELRVDNRLLCDQCGDAVLNFQRRDV